MRNGGNGKRGRSDKPGVAMAACIFKAAAPEHEADSNDV